MVKLFSSKDREKVISNQILLKLYQNVCLTKKYFALKLLFY